MVNKKKVKKKKIESIHINISRSKTEKRIYFKRPCKRCDIIFTPDSKNGRICPNCIIKKRL